MLNWEKISQYKPVFKRMIMASIIASPMVALTNNLERERVAVKPEANIKEESREAKSFFDHRCLGIKPPAP